MATDPAVLAVWQIVGGIVVACVAFTLTYYIQLRLQRNHAFYRFGEAMSIGYAQQQTMRIYEGIAPTMPKTPDELTAFTHTLEQDKASELARKSAIIDHKKKELDKLTTPQEE